MTASCHGGHDIKGGWRDVVMLHVSWRSATVMSSLSCAPSSAEADGSTAEPEPLDSLEPHGGAEPAAAEAEERAQEGHLACL